MTAARMAAGPDIRPKPASAPGIGQDAPHRRAALAQAADQLEALIGGDAARDDQQNAPALQQVGLLFAAASMPPQSRQRERRRSLQNRQPYRSRAVFLGKPI